MTRLLAPAELSMTRTKHTKLTYRVRRTICSFACESHVVPNIQRPARILEVVYQLNARESLYLVSAYHAR